MSNPETFSFVIPVDDFNVSLLPAQARSRTSPDFGAAVNKYLSDQFSEFGGTAEVIVDKKNIQVTWSPGSARQNPIDVIVRKLEDGKLGEAVVLLELLRSQSPDDPAILYNLGMALSDLRQLARAEEYLRRLVTIAPNHVNARVALGVALYRQDKTVEASEFLHEAVRIGPDNPWALRNLAACFIKLGKHAEAEERFRRACEVAPDDQQSLLGLAQTLHIQKKVVEADDVYKRLIEVDGHSEIAELARRKRSQIAHDILREKVSGGIRPDAVMYCQGAIERFEKLPPQEVQKIGFEIALLGMKGLDINDPTPKYQLRSLPGKFSGLHLVCLMYVAFKQTAPKHDVGIDLSKEYQEALNARGR